MSALGASARDAKVVVLGLGRVPAIDATGLVALESALDRLQREQEQFVIIAARCPSLAAYGRTSTSPNA